MRDNAHIDEEEYRDSLSNVDPITRKQLEDGDWDVRAKGNMFDRSWFELVDASPVDAERVRYWDLAATEPKPGKDPAYTSGG